MDITAAVFDPELGCTAFTVERITCTRSRQGTVSLPRTYQASGCVHPAAPDTLRLLPGEEKAGQSIMIYTDFALSTGTPEDESASFTAPDRIRWNGRTWRVIRVRDWQGFGCVQALAVLIQEQDGDQRPPFPGLL